MFMSDCSELLIHPTTGFRSLGIRRGPGRPPRRSPEDGGGAGGTETGQQSEDGSGGNEAGKETETVEFWKAKARDQEKRAKDNAAAARELGELKDAQKTQAEKDADKIKAAEAEVASIPAKVAEALKTHLIARYQIDAEDEVLLTAMDPETLLKQFDRVLGKSDKRKRGNYVADEGNNKTTGDPGSDRQFVRNLFGNNT